MVNCIVIVKPILRRPSSTPATQLCVIFSTTHPSAKAFRINTCKCLSKQMTLTCFRIHTSKKAGGGVTRTPTRYGIQKPVLTRHARRVNVAAFRLSLVPRHRKDAVARSRNHAATYLRREVNILSDERIRLLRAWVDAYDSGGSRIQARRLSRMHTLEHQNVGAGL